MRGSEEQFHAALTTMADLIRRYDSNSLKYIPFVQAVEKVFSDFAWSKDEFYTELNRLRGIQMHPAIKKRRAPKKRKPKSE